MLGRCQVGSEELSPLDVLYRVVDPTRFGYLEIDPPPAEEDRHLGGPGTAGNNDFTFRQEDVNQGRLHYVQSISNQVGISTPIFFIFIFIF